MPSSAPVAKEGKFRKFSIELIPQRGGGYMAYSADAAMSEWGETKQSAIGAVIEKLAQREGELWAIESIAQRK